MQEKRVLDLLIDKQIHMTRECFRAFVLHKDQQKMQFLIHVIK